MTAANELAYAIEMNTNQLQVSLPGSLRDFIEAEALAGSFRTPDDYVAALIANERRRSVINDHPSTSVSGSSEAALPTPDEFEKRRQLEELLLEGINSGPPIEVNDEFWRELRSEVIERHRRATGQ